MLKSINIIQVHIIHKISYITINNKIKIRMLINNIKNPSNNIILIIIKILKIFNTIHNSNMEINLTSQKINSVRMNTQ